MTSFRPVSLSPTPCLANGWAVVSVAVFLFAGSCFIEAQDAQPHRAEPLPAPVKEADFEALKNQSPFLRILDPSKSLILVGLARISGNPVATVREPETGKTRILSTTSSEDSWRIVGVEGDPANIATVSAQISVGKEVFTIRYDQVQVKPSPSPPDWRTRTNLSKEEQARVAEEARNYRDGIRGDGHRGPTPPELVNGLKQLSLSE